MTKKSERRTKLLNNIMLKMKRHSMFSTKVSRKLDTENVIQKQLFLSLEDNESLKNMLTEYGVNEKKSSEYVTNFQWEQKLKTSVHNFTIFSTNHRPDAVLNLDDIRIGIEIKKGDSGASLRSGLGQCLLYSTEYDFVLYLFVDTTPNQNIQKSIEGEREKHIIDGLWKDNNVIFDII